MKISTVEIPDKMADFAKAVAALAETFDIENFKLSMEPSLDHRIAMDQFVRIFGEIEIRYKSKDGRGRPSRKLFVNVKNSVTKEIGSDE